MCSPASLVAQGVLEVITRGAAEKLREEMWVRLPEGALASGFAGWVAVLPWLALLALAATPLAWRAAAARDRRQKVSRWDELHHRVLGDPLSWTAR